MKIDPTKIPVMDLPLIAMSFNSTSAFNVGTSLRTKSSWSHIMTQRSREFFASQNLTGYNAEVKIYKYMTGGTRLKFWSKRGITADERATVLKRIQERAALPWWKTMYDFVGIIGHFFGVKKLQLAFMEYCVECEVDIWMGIIPGIERYKQATPGEINQYLKTLSCMYVYGRYEND